MLEKHKKRQRRHKKIRTEMSGSAKRPRLCVFKTPNHISVQLINDEKGKTLLYCSDLEIKKTGSKAEIAEKKFTVKVGKAYEVGRLIALKALEKKIDTAVFDRAGHRYHGRIKALAEGAREGGLKF
jgi:large subunit ribosomal protein L18